MRRFIYELFEVNMGGRLGYYVDLLIMGLIAANVAAVILETVDLLAARYGVFFRLFEMISVVIFTVEYGARVWSSVEHPDYNGPITGRLQFASRPLLVVDLLAILPFYLAVVGVGAELRHLRALRMIRFLRLFKLARYSESMQMLSHVLRARKPDLLITVFVNGILLLLASSTLYYVEHSAQPDVFSSIPKTLWWGVVTLTTVGYGDVVPVTPLGRFFAALTAVIGIGLFALPASILASGFMEYMETEEHECPHCGETIRREELE